MNTPPPTLWEKIVGTTETALRSGALMPISTHSHLVDDPPLSFIVRVLDSLVRKEAAQKHQASKQHSQANFNPFLPYEAALFVEDLSETHVCLLNKFNVVEHHLLIITRAYEPQDSWLTLKDFEALTQVLIEVDGLGFYNGGTAAGSSQPHKHLQLIPFTSEQGLQDIPIAPLIFRHQDSIQTEHRLANLPFWHSAFFLSTEWNTAARSHTAQHLLARYQQVMEKLGLNLNAAVPEIPYNLLVTREWMLGVRRSQGTYAGIGVNSIGYAGCLLVKSLEDYQRLLEIGPLNLLAVVGQPWTE